MLRRAGNGLTQPVEPDPDHAGGGIEITASEFFYAAPRWNIFRMLVVSIGFQFAY